MSFDPTGYKVSYQIPTPPRPFMDQEKEWEVLVQAMLSSQARLICGLGGVGKFPEGILKPVEFIELADAREYRQSLILKANSPAKAN